MKKSTRIVKRLLALFLVVLMSINTLGALVSDNDGSAFITKAEFDSIKNSFQNQIDQYNTSIDSKIDGAIASYLAGISVARAYALDNLTLNAKVNNPCNLGFANWRTPAAFRDVVDCYANFCFSFDYGSGRDYTSHPAGNLYHGWLAITNGRCWGPDVNYIQYPYRVVQENGPDPNYYSAYYWVNLPFGKYDASLRAYVENTAAWTLSDINRKRLHFNLNFGNVLFQAEPKYDMPTSLNDQPATFVVDYTLDEVTSKQPSRLELPSKDFLGGYEGLNLPGFINHAWTDYDADDKNKNKFLLYNLSSSIAGTTKGMSFNYRDEYSTLKKMDIDIYHNGSTSKNIRAGVTVNGHYHNPDGTTTNWNTKHGTSNIKYTAFNWKYNRQLDYNLDWANLTNDYYNGYFNRPYYKYYGIPLCKTTGNPGKIRLKLRFNNKVLSTEASSNTGYTYQIMDMPFPNGIMPTSYVVGGFDHVLKREVVASGTNSEWTTELIELDKTNIVDKTNGDYIYIKIEPNESDTVVFVEVVGDIDYIEG